MDWMGGREGGREGGGLGGEWEGGARAKLCNKAI